MAVRRLGAVRPAGLQARQQWLTEALQDFRATGREVVVEEDQVRVIAVREPQAVAAALDGFKVQPVSRGAVRFGR